MPPLERPREKALRYGITFLSTEEILALLLGSGGYQNSVIDIASHLLRDSKGLYNLAQKDVKQFTNYKGIGTAKALILSAVFEIAKRYTQKHIEEQEYSGVIASDVLYDKYLLTLSQLSCETFLLIILSRRRQIVHEETLFKGADNNLNISFREIFRKVMLYDGYYIYVMHNHPSGDMTPSKEDIRFTSELALRCEKVGVVLLDHIIVGSNGYYSFLKNAKNKKD